MSLDLTSVIAPEDLLPPASELEIVIMGAVLCCGVKAGLHEVYPIALELMGVRDFSEMAVRGTLERLKAKGYLRAVEREHTGKRGRPGGVYRATMEGRKTFMNTMQVMMRVWGAAENWI